MAKTGVMRLEPSGPVGEGLEPMEVDPAGFAPGSDVPEQTIHAYFADESIGLTVGVWTTTGMQEKPGPYPGDEFMYLLEGRLDMVGEDGKAVPVETGQSFAVRNGIPVSWTQEAPFLKKFFLLLHDEKKPVPEIDSAKGGVVVMDPMALEAQLKPEAENIGGGEQRDALAFTNDDGTMTVGMWETTPFETEMGPFSVHEFCQILEGEAVITDEDGTDHRFGPGEVLFIPKGTVCSWKCDVPLRKYYAIVDM